MHNWIAIQQYCLVAISIQTDRLIMNYKETKNQFKTELIQQ